MIHGRAYVPRATRARVGGLYDGLERISFTDWSACFPGDATAVVGGFISEKELLMND